MNKNKQFKSTLVAWENNNLPEIETFYADTQEEILSMQTKWMNEKKFSKANMHLYIQENGEWKTIEQSEFFRTPTLPDFAFLQCSPHEDKTILNFMQHTVLQVSSGRIVKIIKGDEDDKGFLLGCQTTYGIQDKTFVFSFLVLKLADSDYDLIENNDINPLKKHITENLLSPLAEWFGCYLGRIGFKMN